ncbi:MAG: CDP-alcohol phosphatidyltransferase family protein [Nocardioidaceae bacterium]
MLDTQMRRLTSPPLRRAATGLVVLGVSPLQLTFTGWAAGAAACVAVGTGHWHVALLLWLANRVLDGLDGAVARLVGPTDRGGFLDLVADFSVYAGFVLAVAVHVPQARLACVALLTAYYLSGAAFLALSSLLERRRHALGDERSLRFVGGLAEGTETVVVYAALLLLPGRTTAIVWGFAVAVAVTAAQRVRAALELLPTPVHDLVPHP